MKILLLSAYDGVSHRYWRTGLVAAFPDHEWTVLTLPGRYFSWRIRGNPLSWLHTEAQALSQNFDLLIATSMVDVATLKGLFPRLAATPTLCYFHENQFAYPEQQGQNKMLEPCMVNLYSALASDRLLFNSAFNRDSFFQGVDALMRRLPDLRPTNLGATLADKSGVLPVPLLDELNAYRAVRQDSVFTLVWNHRWEHDKAPDRLYRCLKQLQLRRVPYRLHLLGEEFRNSPAAFEHIRRDFSGQLASCGYLPDKMEYYHRLAEAHLVLSTSVHEFQGLAVQEAVALGALPVVPDRLSYPELFADQFRYRSALDDPEREALQMADKIDLFYQRWLLRQLPPPPVVKDQFWSQLRAGYRREIEQFSCSG